MRYIGLVNAIGVLPSLMHFLKVIISIIRACLLGFYGNRIGGKVSIKGGKLVSLGKNNNFQPFAEINVGVANLYDTCYKNTYVKIGNCNYFDSYSYVFSHKGYVEIGTGCHIGRGVVIQGYGGVTVSDNVLFGPGAKVFSSNHIKDYTGSYKSEKGSPVFIGRNVWIGANSLILSGVTIGEGAIIGAGAIVTKDVEPFCLIVGFNEIKKILR